MMERFSRDHQWIRIDGDVGTVGITDHTQSQLGEVISVELPEAGRKATAGDAVAAVESVKAAGDVFTPVAGEVVEVNDELAGQPALATRMRKARPGSSRLGSRTRPNSGR